MELLSSQPAYPAAASLPHSMTTSVWLQLKLGFPSIDICLVSSALSANATYLTPYIAGIWAFYSLFGT